MSESKRVLYQLEPGEDLVAEYQTVMKNKGRRHYGEAGMLVMSSRRILFYRQMNILKKLIKRDSYRFELKYGIPIENVMKVTFGGMFDKHLNINGIRYYLLHANHRNVANVIKAAVADAKARQGIAPGASPAAKPVHTPAPAPAPALGHASTKSARVYCSSCGRENAGDARFCSGCGAEL